MIKHFKGEPSQFVIKYKKGKIKKAGRGLTFYYMKKKTNIVAIPNMTIDSNFIFNEVTSNFQKISLQGHFTYKIQDPKKMAFILDYSIDPETMQYKTTDPEKLELRITNIVQMETRSEIEKLDLEGALRISKQLAQLVYERVNKVPLMDEMGVQVLSITFNSITPTPAISQALEADYREKLQKKADEAIYERRAAAVEQERKIKENELFTEVSLEEKRKDLIDLKGENFIKDAEFNKKAKELELSPYKELDPKLLLALSLKDLSLNASKIGNLTITSEILSQLLNEKDK
ncbi:MAG: membrane protease subunit, stomatin/prohibitin [Candidatus Lokiarchaeota archaeon]|nr:membrane protease subunit, stomatin/prohibitin [Candidatus Lokiarchaeota archaeon]MBD3339094.1 membrane protease subunit, stomatin/prohibitin [Candidatus Lokiarchaeota archaeon]